MDKQDGTKDTQTKGREQNVVLPFASSEKIVVVIILLIVLAACAIFSVIEVQAINAEYTIQFYAEGEQIDDYIYTFVKGMQLPTPSREGYTFSGWYADKSYLAPFKQNKRIKADTTLYGKWLPKQYSITFDHRGGSGQKEIKAAYKDAISLPISKKIGYVFVGWAEDAHSAQAVELGSMPLGGATLYALFEEAEYLISYDLNGGDNHSTNPIFYTITSSDIDLLEAEKDAYDFGGWYADSSFSKPIQSIAKGSSGNLTLYAKWLPSKYAISFATLGGEPLVPITQRWGSSLVLPIPQRDYYDFVGWFTDVSLEQAFSDTLMPIGDSTLFAKWQERVYTITYYLNGGSNSANNPTTYTTTSPTFALAEPILQDNIFLGWYTDSDFSGQPIVEIEQGGHGDIKLYAKWEITTAVLSFENNGGIPLVEPITATISGTVDLPAINKTGYAFGGWFADNNTFENEFTSNTPVPNGGAILYAKWIPTIYAINYHLNGGEAEELAETYNIETADIILPTPIRIGYDFVAWFASSDFEPTSEIEKIAQGSIGDITLYAKWIPTQYNINYHLNGGEAEGLAETYNIETADIILPTPIRIGYDFVAWFASSDFEPASEIEKIAQGSTGDVTLYAKWIPTQYDINYHLNGGEAEGLAETYNIETTDIILPTPIRLGYDFVAWFTSSDFEPTSEIEKIAQGSTGDIDIYAKWIPKQYTITFVSNGGSEVAPITQGYMSDVVAPIPDYIGYSLEGWYYDNDTFLSPFSPAQMPLGGATLYAKWEEAIYTITYHLDGGENNKDNPSTYTMFTVWLEGYPYSAMFDKPEKEGFTFDGWYASADFSGEEVKYLLTGDYGNIELWAKWYDPMLIYEEREHEELGRVIYIVSYSGDGKDSLVIPSKIEGKHVLGIDGIEGNDYGAFAQKGFNEIYIGEGILEIGTGAFGECETLTFVSLPSTLQTIGAAAFYDCPLLDDVVLPDSITSMGMGAFGKCSSLSSINIPTNEDFDTLELGVFGFSAISEIVIPNNIIYIGDRAFEGCESLVSVELAESVAYIGVLAFANCSNLTSVKLLGSAPQVELNAFSGTNESLAFYVPSEYLADYATHEFWSEVELIAY